MRVETREINIYKFHELAIETQEKVIENWRRDDDFTFSHFYAVGIEEQYRLELKENGIFDSEFHWSGFNNQGDGGCFDFSQCYSDGDELNEFIKICQFIGHKIPNTILGWLYNGQLEIEIKTVKNSYGYHYSHEKTRYIDIADTFFGYADNEDKQNVVDKFCHDLYMTFSAWYINYARKFYNDIENEWDNWNSEECIKEEIHSNEYEFLGNGELYN